MAEETQNPNPEENPEDPEYRKPNPQDNPRNISLNEIAAKVAKTHEVEFAETAATIDDEGNITPPEASPAPSEKTPAEAAPAEATPVPDAPAAPAAPAAPQAVDPNAEYDVVVDGQKLKVKGSAIIDAGYRTFQKETAADFRLQMASRLLSEAEAKHSATPPKGTQDAPPPPEGEMTDAELANAVQFGQPEQAEKAVKLLRGRGVNPEQIGRLVADQARFAAKDELQFQDAMSFVNAEYADLLSNDYIKRLFFIEENRRRAPKERGGEADARPYKDLYKSIGDDLRVSLKMPKQAASSQAPTPPGTVAVRQARKAEAPPVPRTAATRLQEAAAAEKAATPSEIIAKMAAARGKNVLTNRKGT